MTLLFERVRVCPTCYFIYKELEKVYFKNFEKKRKPLIKKEALKGLVRNVTFMKMESDETEEEEDTARRLNQ